MAEVKLKNTLGQTIPVQLKDADGNVYQKNLTRKETFVIDEDEMTPALQAQIDSGILKRRR